MPPMPPDPHPTPGPADGERHAIALFPLSTILTPDMPLSLHIFEERYRTLVAELVDGQQVGDEGAPSFGVVALRKGWEVGSVQDVYPVGTTALLRDVVAHPDGRYDIDAIGQRRFRIHELDATSRPYLVAGITYLDEDDGQSPPELVDSVRSRLGEHLKVLSALGAQVEDTDPGELSTPGGGQELSYAVTRYPALPLSDRQDLLACTGTAERLRAARRILGRELELIRQLRAIPATAAMFRSGGLV